MNNLSSAALLKQARARQVSGEELETFGKAAASRWERGDSKTLSESVLHIVKQAALSPQQVQRVIEYANTDAYLRRFDKEAKIGHSVVNFEGGPADPSYIFKELNFTGADVFDKSASDYSTPPTDSAKTASAETEAAFEALFKTSGPTDLPEENPCGDVEDLRSKLAAAFDNMSAQMSGLETTQYDLKGRLFEHVKQASLGDLSLSDVVQAWQAVGSDENIKVAFEALRPELLENGVFASVQDLVGSLQKTSSPRLVNGAHPLVDDFKSYCEVSDKLAQIREARKEIAAGHEELTTFMKRAASGLVGKAYELSGKAGAKAGRGAEYVVDKLVGHKGAAETAKKIVSKTVEHAPTVGAALAANEVRRHAKYSPTVNKALAHVPGTQQYNQRDYEIANGM